MGLFPCSGPGAEGFSERTSDVRGAPRLLAAGKQWRVLYPGKLPGRRGDGGPLWLSGRGMRRQIHQRQRNGHHARRHHQPYHAQRRRLFQDPGAGARERDDVCRTAGEVCAGVVRPGLAHAHSHPGGTFAGLQGAWHHPDAAQCGGGILFAGAADSGRPLDCVRCGRGCRTAGTGCLGLPDSARSRKGFSRWNRRPAERHRRLVRHEHDGV